LSTGALPQTPLGELTALAQTPSWILGAYFEGERRDERGREGWAGRGKEEGDRLGVGEGRGQGRPPGPQNYFPGAGAVESEYWTSY